MQRCQTKCWKTTRPSFLQRIIYFFFPPKSCDRLTGEVYRKRALCPSCVRRQRSRPSDGSKPLPRLPATGKVYREACLAKRAMYEEDFPSRITKGLPRGGMSQMPQLSRRASRRPAPRDGRHRPRKQVGGGFSQSTSSKNLSHTGPASIKHAQQKYPTKYVVPAHKSTKSRTDSHQWGHSSKPSTTSSKCGSAASTNNSTLHQRGREYLRRLRHKASAESDSSWVSPTARQLENGEVSIHTTYLDENGDVTSWV